MKKPAFSDGTFVFLFYFCTPEQNSRLAQPSQPQPQWDLPAFLSRIILATMPPTIKASTPSTKMSPMWDMIKEIINNTSYSAYLFFLKIK